MKQTDTQDLPVTTGVKLKLEPTPPLIMRAKHTIKLKIGRLSADFTSQKGIDFQTFIYFMLGHFKNYAGVEALTEIRDTITKSINMSHRFDNGQAYDLIPVDIIDEYAEGARIGVGLLNLGTARVTNIQYGQARTNNTAGLGDHVKTYILYLSSIGIGLPDDSVKAEITTDTHGVSTIGQTELDQIKAVYERIKHD